mmetsp:Transcript_71818/g.208068  ORF Transcript_71818/g.208068 Transcript_71818/m.208068 type:complete len:217 (+) Transcript_71818:1039-1689(+)
MECGRLDQHVAFDGKLRHALLYLLDRLRLGHRAGTDLQPGAVPESESVRAVRGDCEVDERDQCSALMGQVREAPALHPRDQRLNPYCVEGLGLVCSVLVHAPHRLGRLRISVQHRLRGHHLRAFHVRQRNHLLVPRLYSRREALGGVLHHAGVRRLLDLGFLRRLPPRRHECALRHHCRCDVPSEGGAAQQERRRSLGRAGGGVCARGAQEGAEVH